MFTDQHAILQAAVAIAQATFDPADPSISEKRPAHVVLTSRVVSVLRAMERAGLMTAEFVPPPR
ncbi:hypothetical protein [Roseomonas sp. BN140053]|uniref:hypothetical protein n=1 Tax=Roseomonas sp. BN140053 TaxID=3391898 RepID=UPI0039ED97A8